MKSLFAKRAETPIKCKQKNEIMMNTNIIAKDPMQTFP